MSIPLPELLLADRPAAAAQAKAFQELEQRLSAVTVPVEAVRLIVQVADELIGWDACYFDFYSAEHTVFPVLNMDLINGQRVEVPLSHSGAAPGSMARRTLEEGAQLLLRDQPDEPIAGLSFFGDTNRPSASLMFVPVRHAAKVIGILSIQSYRLRAYDAGTLAALQTLADHCGGALDRIYIEQSLRAGEARLAGILDIAADAIISVNIAQRITLFNQGAEKIFGYEAGEVLSRPLAILLPERFLEVHSAHLHGFASAPETARRMSERREVFGRRKDGTEFPAEASISKFSENGHTTFTVILRDITSHRQAEELLKRRVRQLALLNDLARDMTAVTAMHDLCLLVAQRLSVAFGYFDVAIFIADEAKRELVLEAVVGAYAALFQPGEYRQAFGQGIIGRVAQSVEPLVVNDTGVQPDFLDLGASRTLAEAAFPIKVGGQAVMGVLNVESDKLNAFDDSEVTLLATVADQLAVAMQKVHLLEQTRREAARAEALVRTAARLNAQLDLDAVLLAVCEETAQALNVPMVGLSLYDEKRGVLVLVAAVGLPAGWRAFMPVVPYAAYAESVEDFGRQLIINDMQSLPDIPDAKLYASLNIRTTVDSAVMRGQKLIGRLIVGSVAAVRRFSPDDLALLKGLADQAALAIGNARSFAEANRRLEQIQALRTIDRAIASSIELPIVLNILLEQVTAQMRVDAAVVLLLDAELSVLKPAAGRGFRGRSFEQVNFRLGEGLAGRVALERRRLAVRDMSISPIPFAQPHLLMGEAFISSYAVPLIAKGRVTGVLVIFNRTLLDLADDALEFLEDLAAQAAIAIDNSVLFADQQRATLELSLAYDTTLEGWSRALDLRDKETEGHTLRVTRMAEALARLLGIDGKELVHVRQGSLLHDIGKMGIPDSILLKPGPLTSDEWVIMRMHPTFAYNLLSPIAYLRNALDIPYCHHEKWDGTGYPRGLKGEAIPLTARLFAVVDVWDALCSDRPYRPAWPEQQVRAHIASLSGTHFDPRVVTVFLDSVQSRFT